MKSSRLDNNSTSYLKLYRDIFKTKILKEIHQKNNIFEPEWTEAISLVCEPSDEQPLKSKSTKGTKGSKGYTISKRKTIFEIEEVEKACEKLQKIANEEDETSQFMFLSNPALRNRKTDHNIPMIKKEIELMVYIYRFLNQIIFQKIQEENETIKEPVLNQKLRNMISDILSNIKQLVDQETIRLMSKTENEENPKNQNILTLVSNFMPILELIADNITPFRETYRDVLRFCFEMLENSIIDLYHPKLNFVELIEKISKKSNSEDNSSYSFLSELTPTRILQDRLSDFVKRKNIFKLIQGTENTKKISLTVTKILDLIIHSFSESSI